MNKAVVCIVVTVAVASYLLVRSSQRTLLSLVKEFNDSAANNKLGRR
jgi:hypothetical protein